MNDRSNHPFRAVRSDFLGYCALTCLVLPLAGVAYGEQRQATSPVQLTLPAEVYATPNLETSIYFDNIVLSRNASQFTFVVSCDLGKAEAKRWTVTPTVEDLGKHPLTVDVRSRDGSSLASAKTTLIVANGTRDDKVRLLIVGDSLTHATQYPNALAELLATAGNPKWRMLGTHRPKNAAPGVAHEGYGGWTWQRFANKYEPNPDGTHRKRSSPFVFLDESGKPALDLPRYFEQHHDGTRPDYIIVMLGINDCFSAPPEDVKAIDARIDAMFAQAGTLIQAFRLAAPEAEIGVCLTTPPNSREQAFVANYGDRYTRWGWKCIQHRLVQRQLLRFAGGQAQSVFLIPTQLNLDPVAGYPANNGVHPNGSGYRQIAISIYAWLKHRFENAK